MVPRDLHLTLQPQTQTIRSSLQRTLQDPVCGRQRHWLSSPHPLPSDGRGRRKIENVAHAASPLPLSIRWRGEQNWPAAQKQLEHQADSTIQKGDAHLSQPSRNLDYCSAERQVTLALMGYTCLPDGRGRRKIENVHARPLPCPSRCGGEGGRVC